MSTSPTVAARDLMPALAVRGMPGPAVRGVVSLLVIVHVTAVFMGPFSMPPQTSELAGTIAGPLRPYMDGLSLGNGYRFFAPEPGPSHLIRYEITLPDGNQVEGVFPDRQEHFPRLRYHRHFMLTEFINTLTAPGVPPDRIDAFARSYAAHLADEYQAREVKLFLRRHYVPRVAEVRAGMKLSDKQLYEERPLIDYQRDAS